MAKSAYAAILFALATTGASAQLLVPGALQGAAGVQPAPILKVHHDESGFGPPAQMLTNLPSESWPITDWYKQTVHDPNDKTIGDVKDVIVDHEGKVSAFIIGVGGFLGAGEKDVAVPYDAILFKKKGDSKDWYLVMNTTKDVVAKAPGYKFDRTTHTWMAANPASTTVGGPPLPRQHEK